MKKAHLMGLLGAATLTLATSAWAGVWSSYITIENLDTAPDGYWVYANSSTPLNNPAGCANTTYAVPYSSASTTEKDLMSKTLLSAFLANRKVRLNMASTVCSGSGTSGYPVYLNVRVDYAQ